MAEATPAPDPPDWMTRPGFPRVNFDVLSPAEVRALFRLTDWETFEEDDPAHPEDSSEESDGVISYDAGTPWESTPGINEQLRFYLGDLTEHDYERAVAVYTAFAESPLPEDRMTIMGWGHRLVDLAQVDHDLAMTMWDRFMRDPDGRVRRRAEESLDEFVSECAPERQRDAKVGGEWIGLAGMRLVDLLDEDKLRERLTMTPADVYRLYESLAYAENGMYLYDLGHAALARLIATLPNDGTAG